MKQLGREVGTRRNRGGNMKKCGSENLIDSLEPAKRTEGGSETGQPEVPGRVL